MDSDLSISILIAYAIGTFVGVVLCELRFDERMGRMLRELAEEGFIKHRVNDDGDYVFIKHNSKEK